MRKIAAAASLAFLAIAVMPAHAITVYSTDFSGISSSTGGTLQGDGSIWGVSSFVTGTPPAKWSASVGNFDYIVNGNSLYTCAGNSGACIELGGSTGFGLGSTTPPSTVDVTLNLAAGNYTVAFEYARQIYGPAGFDLNVNNVLLANFPVQAAAVGWNAFSKSFNVATTGAVTFSFVTPALANNVGAQIDNFSITAVPEPATYGLMLGGLAALGFIARRRRAD